MPESAISKFVVNDVVMYIGEVEIMGAKRVKKDKICNCIYIED